MTKEKCIICGVETLYDFDTNIEYRTHYVEGMGQLCKTCYDSGTYPKSHILIPINLIKDTPNDMELGKAVRKLYHTLIK